jgi:predicted alpha/beta-fold hydrolase
MRRNSVNRRVPESTAQYVSIINIAPSKPTDILLICDAIHSCALSLFLMTDLLLFPPHQLNRTESELSKAKAETEAYTRDAKATAMKKVDEFDKKVENEAAKAKGGISGWFGGK